MLDIEKIKDIVRRDYFSVFDINDLYTELPILSSEFGKIIPGDHGDSIQILKAQDRGCGSYGSFTFTVGYNEFPWHTDTAYWEDPARYLLLMSDKPSSCATIVRTFNSLEHNIKDFKYLAKRAVYLLDIPGKRHYLSPLLSRNDEVGYRLDLHIYKPMNEEAKILSSSVQKELAKDRQRVLWTGRNAALIDNWKVIHSREDAHQDRGRILKRVYLNGLV